MMGRYLGDREGFALMMTIWVVVFLTVVAMSFVFSGRLSTAMTANLRDETMAYYGALSIYNSLLGRISSDTDPTIDFVDEKGRFFLDIEHGPLPERIEEAGVVARVRVTDEEARINLNRMSQKMLLKVLDSLSVDEEDQDVFRDSLYDWIDRDDAHRLNGAEDEYYEKFGYKAKNGYLDLPDELVLIRGFREKLADSVRKGDLLKDFTTFGTGGINVNTAPPSLLALLGLTENQIDMIMAQRNETVGGVRFVPREITPFGVTRTATSYFRIEITARPRGSKTGYRILAVIRRYPAPKGYRFKTLYWKEDVIYSNNKA
ncbi:MAG: hypothetical protein D6726_02855 [Nitrospirae bacterium]|nr:MAG: hypothetical protein D6726_02855 [Nitrospirota bacterium]